MGILYTVSKSNLYYPLIVREVNFFINSTLRGEEG